MDIVIVRVCILVIFVPCFIFLVKSSIIEIKERRQAERAHFIRIRNTSKNPDKEISYSKMAILSELIFLFEVIFLMTTIFNCRFPHFLILIIFIISFFININFKRTAYDAGWWLSKYSRKRCFFFLPGIGGYLLMCFMKKII